MCKGGSERRYADVPVIFRSFCILWAPSTFVAFRLLEVAFRPCTQPQQDKTKA